jgi:hypothetical protein
MGRSFEIEIERERERERERLSAVGHTDPRNP